MRNTSFSYASAGRTLQAVSFLQAIAILIAILLPIFSANVPVGTTVYLLLLLLAIPIFLFFLGKSIKQHKKWARIVGMICSGILLFGFPIGTVIGGYILLGLVYGWESQPEEDNR